MNNKLGYKSENKLAKIFGIFALKKVHADGGEGGTDTAQTNTNNKPVDVSALLSQARKEEKDKLYPKIQALEGRVAELSNLELIHLKRIAEVVEERDAMAKKLVTMEEASKNIITKEDHDKVLAEKAKLENDMAELKKTIISEEDLRARIISELDTTNKIETYRAQILEKNKGLIIPELVTGNTEEEINKSLEKSKARFTELFGEVKATPNPNPAGSNKPPKQSYPSANIQTLVDDGKFTLEDLAKLDPRTAEYKEARKAIFGIK